MKGGVKCESVSDVVACPCNKGVSPRSGLEHRKQNGENYGEDRFYFDKGSQKQLPQQNPV